MLELVVEEPLQLLGLFEAGQIAAGAGDCDRLACGAFAFEFDGAPGAEPAPAAVELLDAVLHVVAPIAPRIERLGDP